MIERLVVPEGCPGSTQNLVGHAAGSPLEPAHDGGHCGMRLEDRVDVIGHDYPRVELVEPANHLTVQEGFHNHTGDSRTLQPSGTGSHAVEALVLLKEGGQDGWSPAFSDPQPGVRVVCQAALRQGSGQAPRHENGGVLRNPVREVSAGDRKSTRLNSSHV